MTTVTERLMARIRAQNIDTSPPPVSGQWFNIRIKPSLSTGELLNIGVGFYDKQGLLHGRVSKDLSRLSCLYDEIDVASFEFLAEMIDAPLGGTPGVDLRDLRISNNIDFSPLKHAAGNSIDHILTSLFSETVSLIPRAGKDEKLPRIEAPSARELEQQVFAHLRDRLGVASKDLIHEEPYVIGADHRVNIPFRVQGKCAGTLANVSYKTPSTAELRLLHAAMSLHSLRQTLEGERLAVFVLRPTTDYGFTRDQVEKIDDVIDRNLPTLEASGVHVDSEASTEALADRIQDWSGLKAA